MSQPRHKVHYVDNGDGWMLELKQHRLPKKLNPKRRPILIVPGYGMNSFIFSYHPSGLSMESYFTREGFEVWSVNLRGQGGARWRGGRRLFGFHELGAVDLKVAVDFVAAKSHSTTKRVDLIGCSLGGTLAFIYTSLHKKHKAGAVVAVGSPLRWEQVHPLARLVYLSPRLVGKIPVIGMKRLVRKAFPHIVGHPLIKLYLHPEMVDLDDIDQLLKTVENPNRQLNREIGEWIHTKDLWIKGHNITEAFRHFKGPLLCVLANADGIVPPLTALSPLEVAASPVKETLVVGTDRLHFAHADLFISRYSHDRVFQPVAEWLAGQG